MLPHQHMSGKATRNYAAAEQLSRWCLLTHPSGRLFGSVHRLYRQLAYEPWNFPCGYKLGGHQMRLIEITKIFRLGKITDMKRSLMLTAIASLGYSYAPAGNALAVPLLPTVSGHQSAVIHVEKKKAEPAPKPRPNPEKDPKPNGGVRGEQIEKDHRNTSDLLRKK